MTKALILRRGGSGASFKIQSFESLELLPDTAGENTIALIGAAPMSGSLISPTPPENPAEGMIWIGTVSGGSLSMELIKGRALVCPISCKQYVNGAWLSRIMLIYKDGAWRYPDAYLYNAGDEFEALTGGWQAVQSRYAATIDGNAINAVIPNLTKNADNMSSGLPYGSGIRSGSVTTAKRINLSPFSRIVFDINLSRANGSAKFYATEANQTTYVAAAQKALSTNGRHQVELDVSALEGEYYVGYNQYASGDYYATGKLVTYSIQLIV